MPFDFLPTSSEEQARTLLEAGPGTWRNPGFLRRAILLLDDGSPVSPSHSQVESGAGPSGLENPVCEDQAVSSLPEDAARLCDLAEASLSRALNAEWVEGTPEVLDALVAVAVEGGRSGAVQWIDRCFHRFPWNDPSRCFRAYGAAVISAGLPCWWEILEGATLGDLTWLLQKAVARGTPDPRLCAGICRRDPPWGTLQVIEALCRTRGPLSEDYAALLPGLLEAAEQAGSRPAALDVIRRIEEGGFAPAAGYAALFDPDARRRFAAWVRQPKDAGEKLALRDLVEGVQHLRLPRDYPLLDLLCRMGTRFALEHLHVLGSLGVSEVDALRVLADCGEWPGAESEPLLELAARGALRDDHERAARLWGVLGSSLEPYTLDGAWTKRGGLDLKTLIECIDAPDPVLLRLADPGRRPHAYESAILTFLFERKVLASLACRCLPDWLPQGGGRRVVAEAVAFEISMVETALARELQKGPLEPRLARDTREVLQRRWEPLVRLAGRLGLDREIERMQVHRSGPGQTR